MMRGIQLVLFFILVSVRTGYCQYNSWIITIATGDTLSGCSLDSLHGDSLRVVWSGFPVSLPVESIQELRYHRKSEFWRGAMYGSAAGAIAGTLGGALASGTASSASEVGVMGALGGVIIGGLAAEYFSRDDRFDFSGFDVTEKKNVIIRILLTQSENQRGADKPK